MKIQNIASWMIVLAISIILLYYGQPVIIPFVIGLLIWFIIKKFRDSMDKIGVIQKYIPRWLKTLISSFVVFGLVILALSVLTTNIENLSLSYVTYLKNIEGIALKIDELFNVDLKEELIHFMSNYDFGSLLQSLFQSLSYLLGNMVMVLFYVVFLIVEEGLFKNKFRLIFEDEASYEQSRSVFHKIEKSMSRYIALKSLVNFCSASLSFILLLIIGIDSPVFWAFLIFIFSFIPSIGPIMATLLPAFFSLIQFGEFAPFLVILFGVGTIVMLIGSLVEPRLMGNTLNISPIVGILSLAIWGLLWGIIGMLLSVPITVMLIIVMSQFSSTRNAAILLSEKGKIKNNP